MSPTAATVTVVGAAPVSEGAGSTGTLGEAGSGVGETSGGGGGAAGGASLGGVEAHAASTQKSRAVENRSKSESLTRDPGGMR